MEFGRCCCCDRKGDGGSALNVVFFLLPAWLSVAASGSCLRIPLDLEKEEVAESSSNPPVLEKRAELLFAG